MTGHRIAIVGAGAAGTVLAHALLLLGVRVSAWFDAPGPRASSTPCALVHPFAGRSFASAPHVAPLWDEAAAWVRTLPEAAEMHAAPLRRIVRPDATGARLLRSLEAHRDELPPSLALRVEAVHADVSAITYGPVLSLDLAAAIEAIQGVLAREGVVPRGERIDAITAIRGGWQLALAHDRVTARQVIVAAGAGTRALLAGVPEIARERIAALEHVEGELLHAPGAALETFVIDAGHLASTRTRWAWGSSYRSLDTTPEASRATIDREHDRHAEALTARLRTWHPGLPEPQAAARWRGIRVIDRRRRRPWSDEIRPGLHVLTALGSTGVLWLPTLARQLATRLTTP